jgi:hypothetical protein
VTTTAAAEMIARLRKETSGHKEHHSKEQHHSKAA